MATNFLRRWIDQKRNAKKKRASAAPRFRPLIETLERRDLMAAPVIAVDLSTYVRVGRFDLPEPTRTNAPSNSLLAQEASAVTYNWDTDSLFVVGDGGTSVVQVSKTGVLINSMTLAPGGSPQGTDFYDTEGITYVGGGKFVLLEERDRQANLFTYVAGGTLHKSDAQTVKLGTSVGNVGLEGISYDPLTGGFILVKEKDPQAIFQTGIDFTAVPPTATNGSATATSSTNLFSPALANLADFSDVFALSNLPSLSGFADYSHLLIISQESGQIVNIDRSGAVSSRLTIVADPGSPLTVPDMTMEGVTMDRDGFLYVVNESGGGDASHPQVWVYAHSDAPNLAPSAVSLINTVTSIPENTSTAAPIKVADIVVTDDGLGVNNLTVTGADLSSFQIVGTGLYLKAGTALNSTSKPSYSVTVNVDDPAAGDAPDASVNYSLAVTASTGGVSSLIITEVAPWSSGNGTLGADWFEVTNVGTAAQSLAGWTMDDDSSAPNIAPLRGFDSIAPGESVIFIELGSGHTAAGDAAKFRTIWGAPATLKIGNYVNVPGAGGVGLGTGGDQVNLFEGVAKRAGVTFGAATTANPFRTFDNSAGLNWNGATNALISTLSASGVNGAFSIADTLTPTNSTPVTATGSPGTVGAPPTPIVTIAATDANAAETGSDPGTLRISRTGSTVGALTVNYIIATGSGQATSADYTPILTGVATIASGQSFADITITPVDDDPVEGSETITLTLFDSGSYDVGSPATATVTIADNDNTRPEAAANPVNFHIDEDAVADQTITLSGTDVETAGADLTFTITQGSLHGILMHGSDVLTAGSTFTGSPADVTYRPTEANYNGADSFKFKVTDTGNPVGTPDNIHESDEVTVAITVDAVNDAPVLTVPGMQTAAEDVAVKVTGISVADLDVNENTGVMKVTLSVGAGKLTVATGVAGGLTAAQIAGNGTAAVVLQGPIAAVNATLAAGITYVGITNFNGTDTLTIVANDLGDTGAGGALTDTKFVSIQVLSPTQQIAGLRTMVQSLGNGNGGPLVTLLRKVLINLLLRELDLAQIAVNQGKPKVAYALIGAFAIEVSLLSPAERDPLQSAAQMLMQSLKIGAS